MSLCHLLTWYRLRGERSEFTVRERVERETVTYGFSSASRDRLASALQENNQTEG